jgi:hypothetical protein
MRRFQESTFVFISTNSRHEPGGAEERWLPVMQALAEKGANVRFLCLMHTPMGEWARTLPGVEVDPYILDMWNVIRARSRLRKYLKRYVPVVAHSTGLEADLILRWAARKVPVVKVAHTLTGDPRATRRRRPIDSLMRRFDEIGMRTHADAVFVTSETLSAEVRTMGVPAERVIFDPPRTTEGAEGAPSAVPTGAATAAETAPAGSPSLPPDPASVKRHLDVYRGFMAERGQA